MIYLTPLMALWGALWWRLRGGALTALTGWDPGTGGMRAIAALGLSLPFLGVSWHYALLIPAWWVSWSLAGWGAFQGMGHETSVEESNPLASLLVKLGLRRFIWIDLIGMMFEGVFVMVLPCAALAWLNGDPWLLRDALWGAYFAPIYWASQDALPVPHLGHFEDAGSELAECLVGALVAAVMWTAVVS